MRHGATFINTGRGAQVNEADMIDVLKARPDLTALLDVTFPEPPVEGSELYTLPNVKLSSHIAGSLNDEVHRMSEYMIDEFKRFISGGELRYEVTEDILITSKS
jgi:phosphoglycerate dehydrogenase-like enzyme